MKSRFLTLDAMRGVAALIVVAYHCSHWLGGFEPHLGFLAVDAFFVLSGFVISYRYENDVLSGRMSQRAFIKRRIIRLAPLYLLGWCLGLGAQVLTRSDGLHGLKLLAAAGPNLVALPALIRTPGVSLFPVNHPFWTLFLEFWVANVGFALLWRQLQGWRIAVVIALAAAALVIFGWRYGSLEWGWTLGTAPLALARVTFSFLVGVALARRHAIAPAKLRVPAPLILLSVAAVLCVPLSGSVGLVFQIAAVVLIFPALTFWGAQASNMHEGAGKLLGDASYASYAIHYPLMTIAAFSLQRGGPFHHGTAAQCLALAVIVACALAAANIDESLRSRIDPRRPWMVAIIGVKGVPAWALTAAAVGAVLILAPVVAYALSAREPATFRAASGRATCRATAGYSSAPGAPHTFLTRADFLAELRADPRTRATPEYAALIASANAALVRPAPSVVDKTSVPPSGDKHDYVSLSTYSWPDPAHPGQSVWRDGQYNPDTYTDKYDYRRLQLLVDDAQELGLAYSYTGDRRYAAKLAENVRRWFIAPETRMNPNLRFAQVDAVGALGNGNGLIDTWHMVFLVEALGLIEPSGELSAADQAALRTWFSEYLSWLQTSPQGQHELNAANNHADFYDLQRTEYALFTGQGALARELSRETARRRLGQITAWGALPAEEQRAKAAHYVAVTMRAFTELATLGECSGVDLWRSHALKGGRIRAIFDRTEAFTSGRKPWPGGAPPTNTDPVQQAFSEAAYAYRDPRYLTAAQRFSDTDAATDEDFRWGALTTPLHAQVR